MTNLSLERRRASDHHLTLYFFGSQEFARVRRGQTFDEGEFVDVDAARRGRPGEFVDVDAARRRRRLGEFLAHRVDEFSRQFGEHVDVSRPRRFPRQSRRLFRLSGDVVSRRVVSGRRARAPGEILRTGVGVERHQRRVRVLERLERAARARRAQHRHGIFARALARPRRQSRHFSVRGRVRRECVVAIRVYRHRLRHPDRRLGRRPSWRPPRASSSRSGVAAEERALMRSRKDERKKTLVSTTKSITTFINANRNSHLQKNPSRRPPTIRRSPPVSASISVE